MTVRLYLTSQQRRPDPEPLVTDDRRTILAGTAAWAVALVICLVLHQRLTDSGRGWWLWTAVAGIALGGYGWTYVRRRRPASPGPSTGTPPAPGRPGGEGQTSA